MSTATAERTRVTSVSELTVGDKVVCEYDSDEYAGTVVYIDPEYRTTRRATVQFTEENLPSWVGLNNGFERSYRVNIYDGGAITVYKVTDEPVRVTDSSQVNVGDAVTLTYEGVTYPAVVRRAHGESYVVVAFTDTDNIPNWSYMIADDQHAYEAGMASTVMVMHKVSTVPESLEQLEDSPEDDGIVTRLSRLLAESQQNTLAAKETHRQDIMNIAEALNNAAERREYCSEFEEEVRGMGRVLSDDVRDLFVETASRTREFEVTVSTSRTVTVQADSADDAYEMVNDSPGDYIDTSYIEWDVEVN
jgi:hypothetical protein